MGKKDKSEKKKGPIKKISKCLVFWKKKKGEKGHENETSSESTSKGLEPESLTSAMCKQDVDVGDVGEHSKNHSRSHFHVDCETDDAKGVINSKGEMPKISEDSKNLQKPPSNEGVNDQLQESHPEDHDANKDTNNQKVKRFTVTAVPEEATAKNDGNNRASSEEIEGGVKTKTPEKEQTKTMSCHSKLNSVDHANVIQNSEKQTSEPSVSSGKFADVKKHHEPYYVQPKLSAINNEDGTNSEELSYQPSLNKNMNFVDKQLSELQDDGISVISSTCAKEIDEHPISRNVEFTEILEKYTSFSIHNSQSKMQHAISSSGSNSSSGNDIILNASKPSYKLDNYGNDADQNHTQIEVCQSDLSLASCIGDVDRQNATDQVNVDNGLPQTQIYQYDLNSSSTTNKYVVEHSDPSTSKLCSDVGAHINDLTSEQGKSQVCNDMKHSESQAWEGNAKTDSDSFIINSLRTVMLTSKKEDSETIKSEAKDAFIVETHVIRESSDGLLTSGLSNCSSNSNLDAKVEKAALDEDSNIDSEDEPPELTFILQVENENNNQFSFTSHTNDNNQVLHEYEGDDVAFQSVDINDNSLYISKDDESFRNKDAEQTAEDYPSISQTKETSEAGTITYLPKEDRNITKRGTQLSSPEANENQKALSDPTMNGDPLVTDDFKCSETCTQEKWTPELKDDFTRSEEIASVQRTPSSANSTKQSRLPVRKSLGSENIADRISRLSNEIEELRKTGIKEKSDNRPRASTAVTSRSKIPRKFVSSSAMCK